MCQVRFISDYHFGHKSILNFRPQFNDIYEMNDHIVKCHNEVVNKKDLTYILGDITMETDEWYFYLDQMNGRKKVVLGNHDLGKHVPELLKYVEEVSSMIKYKGMFLTHCPIHPQELQYRVHYNIHGHLHEYVVKDGISKKKGRESYGKPLKEYINVSCEQVDYRPKTLEELIPNYKEWKKSRE